MNLKDTVVVDLDGTLADGRWRLHLLPTPERRHLDEAWAEFNLAGADDPPFQDTIDIVNSLSLTYRIIILTGRGAVAREVTEQWLDDHGVVYDKLIMREIGDCRKDTDFKRAQLEDIGIENIVCAFDDLPHIVDFMRELGITVYEVTRYEDNHEYVHANAKYDGDKK
jgi:FMN phosphatase YigB (HAD superfamily)